MNFIILLPGVWTALLGAFKGWRVAFIYGLLPALIFFPNYYIFKVPGVPELSFWSGSILAVFACWLAEGGWRRLRLEATDGVVLLYVIWCVAAEQKANGLKEAQNLFGKQVLGVVLPYVLGRSLRQDSQMLWNCLKMMTVYAAFLFLLAPYEARMGSNPFDFWRSIMPNSDWGGVLYRNGVRRVAGSFSHSICYGYFAMMMLPIAIWLHVTRSFASQWRSWAVILLCLLGLYLSGSRGAALGACVAVLMMLTLWSPHRKVVFAICFVTAVVGALLVWPAVEDLMAMNRNEGSSDSVQTAAYRAEMIRDYMEVCRTRPWFGFGRDNLPVVQNMRSIDNQYLWLSLTYGIPSAALLVLAAAAGIVTQIPSVAFRLPVSPWSRFDAVLVGILLGAIGVQATVFAGTQTEQFFFLFVGMGGAPKVVGLTLDYEFGAHELPERALSVSGIAGWWRRNVTYPRAEHGPLAAGAALPPPFGFECAQTSAQIPFTCATCVQYPPYEVKPAATSWLSRIKKFFVKPKATEATVKPICDACGWYRHCELKRDPPETTES